MSWLVDGFLRLWLRRLRYPWSRLRRGALERGHSTAAVPHPQALKDIADLLRQVTWTLDGPFHLYDSVSYPQTVWARKRDDCDGFAVLAAELLRRWDPETQPVLITVMLHPVKESHTVCAFRSGASWGYFDLARLKEGPYQSPREVAAAVAQRGTRLVCWDVADPWTLRTREFHTPPM